MNAVAAWPQSSSMGQPGATSVAAFASRPGIREHIVVLVTLFVYAWGTPVEWLAFSNEQVVESSSLTQILLGLFLLHSIVCLNGNWHVVRHAMAREPLVAAFVGLLTFSFLWSTNPILTIQEGLTLGTTLVTAMHLIVRFSLRKIVWMIAVVFGLGAILNYGFVAAFESLGSFTFETDGSRGWEGITPNRNTLGRAAVIGTVVCAVNTRLARSWIVWPFFTLLNVGLVFGSSSATTLGAFLGISTLSLVFLGFRGRKTLYGATAVSMTAVFSVLTVLAASDLATVTGLLGRESNFTGRLPLWKDSYTFGIRERPLLGFGHGGFWRQGFADFEVRLRSGSFDVPHAHNAWVDAWLEVGPLGVLLLSGLILRGLWWSTRHIRSEPTAIGLFPALVVSLAVIFSLTESGFVSRSIQFILFVVALTTAAQEKGVRRPYLETATSVVATENSNRL